MDDTTAVDPPSRSGTPQVHGMRRALFLLVTMTAVLAGVFALHSVAGGHALAAAVASVAEPDQRTATSSPSEPALPADGGAGACDACAEDCTAVAASCPVAVNLVAAAAPPAPSSALARTMSAWPALILQFSEPARQHLPTPSLLQLSINRV